MKRGDHVNNGAIILEIKNDVVLCYWKSRNEFVVWDVDKRGDVASGIYHSVLENALVDFNARAGLPSVNPDWRSLSGS